ncbi:MAG: hypothetical protein O3A95_05030 [Planctomycetota bacterium]|nr:hypothetical protein [Planctomycetota bacterium]
MNHLVFSHLPPPWVLGLLIVPIAVLISAMAYRLRKRSRVARRFAMGLRLMVFATVLFLSFGPALQHDSVESETAPLALLLDDSASMRISDSPGAPSRLTELQSLLASPLREEFESKYQLQAWRYSERLAATTTNGEELSGAGQASSLGNALEGLLAEYRGRRMPDVVLFGDGRTNLGNDPLEAADRLRAEGVKLHAVSFGQAEEAPDLILERVQTPDLVLAGDVGLFSLRLRAGGSPLPERAVVRLLDELGNELDRAAVEELDENGVNLVLSALLQTPGERRLVAEVLPMAGETATDNNRLELSLTVKEVKVRVLYVEGKPRWEYRFIRDRLIRAERDVMVNLWLADADRSFPQEHSRGTRSLLRLPIDATDLLDQFDLVVLGDVDPTRLTPDPLDGQRFLAGLSEFVEKGGGLLMLAGPMHNPRAYVGSPIEDLLPVLIGKEALPPQLGFAPIPPDLQRPHPVVLFSSDQEENRQLWETSAKLEWYQPVERLRPGATAWLVNPDYENQYGPHILAASIFAPEGWVGWIGTDETWRWRFPGGERYVDRFWRSALRHLAATRLRGDRGRIRLDLDRSEIELGAFLQVEVRLLDDSFQPVVDEEGVPLFLEGAGRAADLRPIADQPGIYRGRLRASTPGAARVYLTADGDPDSEAVASARFHVSLPSREMADTSQDRALLTAITGRTGGMLVSSEEANLLLETLDGRERVTRILNSSREPLSPWPFLGLAILCAAAEWILRKRLNLS